MQIFYPHGVISGTWVDENSLVYCAVQTGKRFVRRKGYVSKQHSSCVSRAGNKNVKILDISSSHSLNYLSSILKLTELQGFFLYSLQKNHFFSADWFQYQTPHHPKFYTCTCGMFLFVSNCIIMTLQFPGKKNKTRKKNLLLFSPFCSFNLMST